MTTIIKETPDTLVFTQTRPQERSVSLPFFTNAGNQFFKILSKNKVLKLDTSGGDIIIQLLACEESVEEALNYGEVSEEYFNAQFDKALTNIEMAYPRLCANHPCASISEESYPAQCEMVNEALPF